MSNPSPDFYLASEEGYGLVEPRRCWKIRRVATPNRTDVLMVRIEPRLCLKQAGAPSREIDVVLLATRHRDSSLFPIMRWPVYVHVAQILVDDPLARSEFRIDQFETIAWAELYRTEQDARLKRL